MQTRIQLVYFLLCLLLTGVIAAPVAAAHHEKSPTEHLGSVHSSVRTEEFCTQSTTTAMTATDLGNRITNSIWRTQSWDKKVLSSLTDLYYLDFYFKKFDANNVAVPCDVLTNAEKVGTEIHYIVKDDTSAQCASSPAFPKGFSCVVPGQTSFWSGSPHREVDYYYVYLNIGHIGGSAWDGTYGYNHTINHETGHTLGLADPGYGNMNAASGYEDCYEPDEEPDSVMHSRAYGCHNTQFPSVTNGGFSGKWYDLLRVENAVIYNVQFPNLP
jgi:hypothetical protein